MGHKNTKAGPTGESERIEMAQKILDSAPLGVIEIDLAGKILYGNPAYHDLLRVDNQELIGSSILDRTESEEERKVLTDFLANMVQDQPLPPPPYFSTRRTKNGGKIGLQVDWNYQRDGEGKLIGFVAVLTNVTERIAAEEALHESETKFRDLVETSQDLIFTFDVEGRFTYLNPAWKDTLGYELQDMLGHHFSEFKSPTTTESVHGYILEGGTIEGYESEYLSKSNKPVILSFKGKPLYDKDGVIIGTQGTAVDITKQKQVEKQLLESQKMDAVGQLAGGIAHDFNNLLTAINGYSDLLLDNLRPDDPMHHDLSEIKKAGVRAAALTRQLLAFGRKQILQPKVLDLVEIVAEIEDMLLRLIGEHIDLNFRYDEDLQKIKADPGQIEQVVINLVINARDAMAQGGNITVRLENIALDDQACAALGDLHAGDYAMLSVSDTGSGMNEETLSHIFEPFYTTKGVEKGTGLGLSTVFGIVKQSGGEIKVESEPGKGTIFRIYLPQVEAPIPAEEIESLSSTIEGNETILLVEDEDIIREMLKRVLERLGYTVLVAQHGGEALRIAENHEGPIDLIVTDVVMPQMSGHELVQRLVPYRSEMSVLYMSGYDDEMVADQGLANSEEWFLQKPFGPKAVGKKIREILDKPATVH